MGFESPGGRALVGKEKRRDGKGVGDGSKKEGMVMMIPRKVTVTTYTPYQGGGA